jgi:hypothetical protein
MRRHPQRRLGWKSKPKSAKEAGFDVLVTADQNIRYQQNLLKGRKLALVVLGSNIWPIVRDHIVLVRLGDLATRRRSQLRGLSNRNNDEARNHLKVAQVRCGNTIAQFKSGDTDQRVRNRQEDTLGSIFAIHLPRA